uniref:Oxidoreductase, short chain dehydrogenase/reductase family protein n=1 Tax=Syphacia muris TaxID=451379 RepID=A0A0N5AES4_9BILA
MCILNAFYDIPFFGFIIQQVVWIVTVYLLYYACSIVFALLKAVLIYRVIPLFYSPPLNKYKNRWTVVTGGTDGIGKAYTIELAKYGFKKFVLIGRNPKKLDDVKRLLEEGYSATVNTYLFDFSNGDYDTLRLYINSIEDIGFVLNSVGVGREKLERYGENPDADNLIFKVNGYGATQLLSMVLKPMRRNGGGQIVSVSSCLGYAPVKYLAAYSATKTLVNYISSCIDSEYDNIDVQILTPSAVATAMTYYKDESELKGFVKYFFVVTPQQLAYEAVRTIGLVQYTSGTLTHEIQLALMHLPRCLSEFILNQIISHENKRVLNLLKSKRQISSDDSCSTGAA